MKKKIIVSTLIIVLLVMLANIMKIGTLLTALAVPFTKNDAAEKPSSATAAKQSLYDFKMKSLDGKETVDLSKYKGKKVVILNVASKCGFTPQYADWEKFYKENSSKVVVLGFPANEFGSQESGTNSEIATFCQKNYGVSFPMFEKIVVKGDGKHPLYKWLSTKVLNGWNDQEPSWNFCKYLVNENGELTHFFKSGVKPGDKAFQDALASAK